jgi:hypothetical protein
VSTVRNSRIVLDHGGAIDDHGFGQNGVCVHDGACEHHTPTTDLGRGTEYGRRMDEGGHWETTQASQTVETVIIVSYSKSYGTRPPGELLRPRDNLPEFVFHQEDLRTFRLHLLALLTRVAICETRHRPSQAPNQVGHDLAVSPGTPH